MILTPARSCYKSALPELFIGIHVYFEEGNTFDIEPLDEDESYVIEVESDPEPMGPITPASQSRSLGICCGILLVLLCLGTPLFAIGIAQAYPNTSDATLSRTVTLILGNQVPLMKLTEIRRAAQSASRRDGQHPARRQGSDRANHLL